MLGAAEAMNNAIDHATGDRFVVSVALDGATGIVTITDTGSGFAVPPRPAMPHPLDSRHRGLAVMHALVDHVDISAGPTGTTVTLAQDMATANRHHVAASKVA